LLSFLYLHPMLLSFLPNTFFSPFSDLSQPLQLSIGTVAHGFSFYLDYQNNPLIIPLLLDLLASDLLNPFSIQP
jgi:hypothetical protein